MQLDAVVLAGGKSSRMGRDKALLPWQGQLYIEHVISQLPTNVNQIMIACDKQLFSQHAHLQKRCISDYLSEAYQGPLSGIAAALQQASTDWLLVCACDVYCQGAAAWPQLLAALESPKPAGIIIACDNTGRQQPLVSLWHKSCLTALQHYLAQGQRRLMGLVQQCGYQQVLLANAVANLNTPEQFAALQPL